MTQKVHAASLPQLRRDAKRLANSKSIGHSQALDEIAVGKGYQNWSLLMKNVEEPVTREPSRMTAAPLARAEVQQLLGLPKMLATKDETRLIQAIVQRYFKVIGENTDIKPLWVMMDIEACHCNGCPLDLTALLEAPRESDLVHDVAGIQRYLNRDTGVLEGFFTPRYAKQ